MIALLLGLLGSLAPSTPHAAPANPQETGALQGELARFERLIGLWEVNAEWADGRSLFARAEYRPGIGGHFLEGRVFVSEDGQPLYQRYHNVFRWDAERGAPVGTVYHADGSVKEQVFELDGDLLVSEWSEGGALVRDETELLGDDALRWSVFLRPPGAERFTTLLEARWRRVPAKRPIDADRIVGAGLDVRSLVRETTIDASPEDVFAAWADAEVFPAAYAPESPQVTANIELTVGGPYEWLFDGQVGNNGCQVLSFVPNRMLSFTWIAPPSQPKSRSAQTWVVVEVTPIEGGDQGTHVRLTHLGFGDEPHWDETYAYFESAWSYVLQQFKTNLEKGAG